MANLRSAGGNPGRSRSTKSKTPSTRLKGNVPGRPNFISSRPAGAPKPKPTRPKSSGKVPQKPKSRGTRNRTPRTFSTSPRKPEGGIGTASRGRPGGGINITGQGIRDAIGESNPIDKLFKEIGASIERALR